MKKNQIHRIEKEKRIVQKSFMGKFIIMVGGLSICRNGGYTFSVDYR